MKNWFFTYINFIIQWVYSMYCLYMFCRGILVIGPKRAVEDCGARYEFYRCSGRPDLGLRTSGRHRNWFPSFAPQTVLSPQGPI